MKRYISKSLSIATDLYSVSTERFSHFAFIFSKNELISIGKNNTTRPDMKALYFGTKFNVPEFKKYPYLHAEISAIGKLWGKRVITGKENFVVIRIGPNGLLPSKPCIRCTPVLKALGFQDIWYSVNKDIILGAI